MLTSNTKMRREFLAVSYVAAPKSAGCGPGSLQRIRTAAQEFLMCQPVWPDAKMTGLWLDDRGRRNTGAQAPDNLTVFLNSLPRDAPSAESFGSLLVADESRYFPQLNQKATKILEQMVPPFALVQCDVQDGPVVAATDFLGYWHLYWYEGDGWAAISSSALALAYCANVKNDEEALANRSLLGFHLAQDTPFQCIHKLGPGGFCVLRAGHVQVGAYTDATNLRGVSDDRPMSDLTRDMAGLLRNSMSRYVEEYPELVLQLSGGLDSRVELAAIPPKHRPGLRALTLAGNDSRDVGIAVGLANAAGLRHQVLSLGPMSDLDPIIAWQLVRLEAIRHNCSGDPVAHAVLAWAEDQLDYDPRVHGAGGEVIRGFYYAGQRQRNTASPANVSRLARWRLFPNSVVEPGCLGAARAAWAREVTVSRLQKIFNEYDCDWLTATDMFYTLQRMSRWAGLHLTMASTERLLLNPLLDSQFVRTGLSCSPRYKRGSRLMASILCELDPVLASTPLDSGYVPAQLVTATIPQHLNSLQRNASKVAKKIRQRVSKTSRAPNDAETIARLVLSHWRSTPHLFNTVARTTTIDTEWLEQVLESRRTPDAVTIGYVANLQVMSEQMNS
jgi:asparagine synthase (glutamine-hydrolysing)